MNADVAKLIGGVVLIIVFSTLVLNGDKFSKVTDSIGKNVVDLTKAANGT